MHVFFYFALYDMCNSIYLGCNDISRYRLQYDITRSTLLRIKPSHRLSKGKYCTIRGSYTNSRAGKWLLVRVKNIIRPFYLYISTPAFIRRLILWLHGYNHEKKARFGESKQKLVLREIENGGTGESRRVARIWCYKFYDPNHLEKKKQNS